MKPTRGDEKHFQHLIIVVLARTRCGALEWHALSFTFTSRSLSDATSYQLPEGEGVMCQMALLIRFT